MKKICKSVNGNVLFEYEGLLIEAVHLFMENEFNKYFDQNKLSHLHFCFNLSAKIINNEHLEGFCGINEDLYDSDFQGSDLYWSSFRGANLENVNFSYCDLRGGSFNDANMKNVNLEGANLSFANMGGGADLSGADLTGANLNDTNLNRTEYDARTIFSENFVIPILISLTTQFFTKFHKTSRYQSARTKIQNAQRVYQTLQGTRTLGSHCR
ncbi:MAG: pentapeptide repeat-containing protein [Planctomycetaceae bacterium]|jgi:uncharacterized protein YjbI with pentapeptide repeats|nr:pentapeptide repeat-containing protein [Planctomycetaceae bacterium]